MSQLMEARSQEIQVTSPELDLMSQQAGVDIWGILARRKWLVILGMILGSGLGYIYLLQADPVYESVAQVLIEEKQAPSLPLAGFDTELVVASEEAKHAVVIRSPRILSQAFKDYSLEKLPTFLEDPQPLVSLSEQLDVEIVEEGTHVLNVSYRGPNPDDTQKVTGSIVRIIPEIPGGGLQRHGSGDARSDRQGQRRPVAEVGEARVGVQGVS